MKLEYRVLHDVREYERVVDLEILVWGLAPRDAVASSILHAIVHNGGLIVGAYDDDVLVGTALALPARRGRRWLLWSHMTAVHPVYQGQGIGFGLKRLQRTWALENGYDTISWTFDPLQRGNANFNLHRLGAVSNIYHVEFYGEMTDDINAGLPSDRLEVTWRLRDRRVVALMEGTPRPEPAVVIPADALLLSAADETLSFQSPTALSGSRSVCYAEIPGDLPALKKANPGAAYRWRLALRDALMGAFSQGWHAADVVSQNGCFWYALRRPEVWFLYVVECNDQSLYTGITTDLRRRLNAHNAGRGAVYTAARVPVRMVAAWRFSDRSSALKAEVAFKRQSRRTKLRLIGTRAPYREMPFVELD